MTQINRLLKEAAGQLRKAGLDGAERDARLLLAHALDCEPSRLLLIDDIADDSEFWRMVASRCQFQPVSQIIGYREFWGRRFQVTSDVLDPRPDTETVIELALSHAPKRVLDLGTGTGILGIILALETGAEVVMTDISPTALDIARGNAVRLGAAVDCVLSDWFENVTGEFDMILSNPPYITAAEMNDLSRDVRDWEPHLALTPGVDGLDAYRQIAAGLDQFLMPDGLALLEIGYLQADDVKDIFRQSGFKNVTVHIDLAGKDRVVAVKR